MFYLPETMSHDRYWKADNLEPRNLIIFFIIAFGWSWFIWFLFIGNVVQMPAGVGTPEVNIGQLLAVLPILILSPFGPTISAFLVTYFTRGKAGVQQIWSRFWNRDIPRRWLLTLILLQPVYYLSIRLISQYVFGVQQPRPVWLDQFWMILPPFFASILHGGLSEEFGWRGYALPRLQAKYTAFQSSIILGLLEGLWHYPLILMPWDDRYGMSVVVLIVWQTIGTFYRTWIFNNTNGSILAAVLFHAVQNTAGYMVPVNVAVLSFLPSLRYVPPLMMIIGLVFVALMVAFCGAEDMV
jgi:membrane protease YdiL (CAAX protease family)